MINNNKNNLIWIDLEMTGLNPVNDYILEIATIVTDSNLNILSEGPDIAIFQTEKKISKMNKWNFKIHTNNGLINKVKSSKYNEQEAEIITIEFLKKWIPAGFSPICGNSIGQDRRFLFKYMPKLEKYFHYRYIDVSSIKELVLRWNPKILSNFIKNNEHKALLDIRSSIKELIYYRKYFIKI